MFTRKCLQCQKPFSATSETELESKFKNHVCVPVPMAFVPPLHFNHDYQPFDEFAYYPGVAPVSARVQSAANDAAFERPLSSAPSRKLVRSSAMPGDDFGSFGDTQQLSPVADEPTESPVFSGRVRKHALPLFATPRKHVVPTNVIDLISGSDDEDVSSHRLGAQTQTVAASDDDDDASVDNRASNAPPIVQTAQLPPVRRPQAMLKPELSSASSSGESFRPILTPKGQESLDDASAVRRAPVAVPEARGESRQQLTPAAKTPQRKSSQPKSSQPKSSAATPVVSRLHSFVAKSPAMLAYEAAVVAAAEARAQVEVLAAAAGIVTPPTGAASRHGHGSGQVSSARSVPTPIATTFSVRGGMSPLVAPRSMPSASAAQLPEMRSRYEALVEERLLQAAIARAERESAMVGLPKMPLAEWLYKHRQLLLQVEGLWSGGATRSRDEATKKSRLSYISTGRLALDRLGAGVNANAMTDVTTAEQIVQFSPPEIVRAIASALPREDWLERLAGDKMSSTVHQAGLFIQRLTDWAIECVKSDPSMASMPELDLCRPLLGELKVVVKAARRKQRIEVNDRRLQVNKRSSDFQLLAETVRSVAIFKVQCDDAVAHFDFRRASLLQKSTMALLALTGMFDTMASRFGIVAGGATDAGRCPRNVNIHSLSVVRHGGGVMTLHAGAEARQKGHLLAPFELQNMAPATTRVLNALLDDRQFVHGGAIAEATPDVSLQFLALDMCASLRLSVPEVLNLPNGGIGGPAEIQRSSCRRMWTSMTLLLVFWRVLDVAHFVAVCFTQMHDPRTANAVYNVFGGLFALLGTAAHDCEAEIVDLYNEVMVHTHEGVVSGPTHDRLIEWMWQARNQVVRACHLLAGPLEFECPKCGARAEQSGLGFHMAVCIADNVKQYSKQREEKAELRKQVGGRSRTPAKANGPSMRLGGAKRGN